MPVIQNPPDAPVVAEAARKITVILNPVSCPNGVEAIEEEITASFGPSGGRPKFVHTCKSAGAASLAHAAIDLGAELLIAAGGDGTIMETINAAIGTNIPVGIVPLGTGNMLATNLKLPFGVKDAIDVALHGRPTGIDLVRVADTGKCFAIMSGVGYDAQIMDGAKRKDKQKLGRLAYLVSAIKNLRNPRFMATVKIDDNPPIRSLVKCVLVANLGELVPGMSLFPNTAPDDGVIEVGILKAHRARQFLSLAFRFLLGRVDEDPMFDSYQAKRVHVELGRPQPFETDGDLQARVTTLDLEVAPKAALIMLPS